MTQEVFVSSSSTVFGPLQHPLAGDRVGDDGDVQWTVPLVRPFDRAQSIEFRCGSELKSGDRPGSEVP